MTARVGADLAVGPASLAVDVRRYLTATPRQLPSRALYDTLGSALFDAICHLPWYPVTRAERRLLAAHRRAIFDAAGWPDRLVELGCGNGEKLLVLLGPPEAEDATAVVRIDLVDISESALAIASRLVGDGRHTVVVTHQRRYEDGLARAAASRAPNERLCVLFLGSNIGNFDPPGAAAFLATIRAALEPGDHVLVGADLVKPPPELLLAYDDPLGVTAAFNKNLLQRLNRELGATFEIGTFDHRAVWNAEHSRVEMHLVSRTAQRVDVPRAGLSIDFKAGETIWTESSYKYDVARVEEMLEAAGFMSTERWIDQRGRFLLTLAQAT